MSDEPLLQSIGGLAERLQSLNRQAVREYTPVVESILRCSRDIRQIEHTLDGLLDFCGYDPALVLFKTLCRHYWEIDPLATTGYVQLYREIGIRRIKRKHPDPTIAQRPTRTIPDDREEQGGKRVTST